MTTVILFSFRCLALVVLVSAKNHQPNESANGWTRSKEDSRKCLKTQNGADYNGTLNITESGKPCRMWSDVLFFGLSKHYALEAKNYCRNPNGAMEKPWCYVFQQSDIFQYCDIPECKEEKGEKDQNSQKQNETKYGETEEYKNKIKNKLTECPYDFMKFRRSPTEFTCLRMFHNKLTWLKAYQRCQTYGPRGRLAFLDTHQISVMVYNRFKKQFRSLFVFSSVANAFHIGLRRMDDKCSAPFQWFSEEVTKPLQFTSWGDSEPNCNDGKEFIGQAWMDYVPFSSNAIFTWNDQSYDVKSHYLCEIPFA